MSRIACLPIYDAVIRRRSFGEHLCFSFVPQFENKSVSGIVLIRYVLFNLYLAVGDIVFDGKRISIQIRRVTCRKLVCISCIVYFGPSVSVVDNLITDRRTVNAHERICIIKCLCYGIGLIVLYREYIRIPLSVISIVPVPGAVRILISRYGFRTFAYRKNSSCYIKI